MSLMSWQLPHAPLFGRVLLAQVLGVVTAVAAAAIVGLVVPTTQAYAWKAALACVAIGVVAVGYVRENHPFDAFGAANHVTTFRAVLVALVAALIGEARTDAIAWTAAVISLVATALDGVDGWLARRSSMESPFGARFDMEVDALLIMVLAVIAWHHGKAGAWIVLAGAMRYLFVAAGRLWRWLEAPLPPSTRRQAICVVQIVGLGAVVSPFIPFPLSMIVAAVTLASLLWSFGVDVIWLRRYGA
jgi:phosphatidylglycerophosphate synthase